MDKINIGQAPGGRHDGTPLRIAFDMINKNFDYLGSYSGRIQVDVSTNSWYDVASINDIAFDIELGIEIDGSIQSIKVSGGNLGTQSTINLLYSNILGEKIFDYIAITNNNGSYNVSFRASKNGVIDVGYFSKSLINAKPLEVSFSNSPPMEILERIEL